MFRFIQNEQEMHLDKLHIPQTKTLHIHHNY